MTELPTGTVTFLLTDVQDSTRLWEQYPQDMAVALSRHDQIIEEAAAAFDGVIIRPRGEGDSRFAVFENADHALSAVVEIQQQLAGLNADFPFTIRVRAGMHTGSAGVRAGDYYGTAVNLCARIRGLAHGGQTLLSAVTAQLVSGSMPIGTSLNDLGSYKLKGLSRPEKVYQLSIDGLPRSFPPLEGQDTAATNLPTPPTNFIGRKAEVEQISDLLQQDNVRLVTLTGPGGTGKTRLCLETGRRLLNHFPDGVYFVELASIVDPTLTATTIARTLGIREGGGRPPLENLMEFLAGKEMLLILDNFEQIIDAADVVSQLLEAASSTQFLVTSRISLALRGEQEIPISPMNLPKSGSLPPQELIEFEAVQLFLDRVQAIRPAFELDEKNARAVLEICRRLDGLPLAIEIAAARIRILTPQAILGRLDQSLNLLVGGPADLPTRQQTMRSVIDWSYDLLDEADKTLLARLSVFAGGFTFGAAEAICNKENQLDLLLGFDNLARNSLIRQVDSVSDDSRFDMLVLIREYAQEKLVKSGQEKEFQQRHAQYFGDQAEWAKLSSGESTFWLKSIDEDHDNFRAALSFSLNNLDYLEIAVRVCGYLSWFWYRFGHFEEGRKWTERVLVAAENFDEITRGLSLLNSATMTMWEGDLAVAAQRGELALKILNELKIDRYISQIHFVYGVILINQGRDSEAYGNLVMAAELFDSLDENWFQSTVLVHLANAALGLGQYKDALTFLDSALPLAQAVNDPWQLAFTHNNYGEVYRAMGQFDKAEQYYQKTEELFREADAASDHARLLYALATIAVHKEQYNQANLLYHQSLQDFLELGNKRGIAECLAGIACLAAEQGEAAWGLPLFSAAEKLMTTFGAAWWPADRVDYERSLALMRTRLGAEEFERLQAEGQTMDLKAAVAYTSGNSQA